MGNIDLVVTERESTLTPLRAAHTVPDKDLLLLFAKHCGQHGRRHWSQLIPANTHSFQPGEKTEPAALRNQSRMKSATSENKQRSENAQGRSNRGETESSDI